MSSNVNHEKNGHGPSKSKEQDEIERLKREVAALKELANKHLESRAHMQADFENFRKLKDKERKEYLEYGIAPLLRKLLHHYEDLEKGIQLLETTVQNDKVIAGFKMIKRNLETIFREEGVKPMESKGKPLDTNKQEVVLAMESAELDEDTVMDEVEKGYMYKNRVLRPAKVIVSKKPEKH